MSSCRAGVPAPEDSAGVDAMLRFDSTRSVPRLRDGVFVVD
jgi:hypothetical protein